MIFHCIYDMVRDWLRSLRAYRKAKGWSVPWRLTDTPVTPSASRVDATPDLGDVT